LLKVNNNTTFGKRNSNKKLLGNPWLTAVIKKDFTTVTKGKLAAFQELSLVEDQEISL
jgi:hypothetical protein